MIFRIFLMAAVAIGLWLLLTGLFPHVQPTAQRAVLARKGKKESISTMLINKLSLKIEPFMHLESLSKEQLSNTLFVLGKSMSPEMVHAEGWAAAVTYFCIILICSFPFYILIENVLALGLTFSSFLVVSVIIACVFAANARSSVFNELKNAVQKRKEAIEWELPQFTDTILQSLSHTTNVIYILERYLKIAGNELHPEIQRTITDMKMGNHEQALQNLSLRINSGAFAQLVQGLVGIVKGENQQSYFQILSNDLKKMKSEHIKKEILLRPKKLTINNILLLVAMVTVFFVAIGSFLMDTSAGLF